MIDDQIEQLPEDIKTYLNTLIKERDSARQSLDAYLNTETKSPFSYMETIEPSTSSCSIVTKYIQSNELSCVHQGVCLHIELQSDYIELSYHGEKNSYEEVCLLSANYQTIRLVSRENMKD